MPDPGTRQLSAELLLSLERPSRIPLRVQLERGLRDLIQSCALREGTALPSSRTLAADLGVSRRLVVEAYEQLTAEGYLQTHARSGTRVARVGVPSPAPVPEEQPSTRFDLRPGVPTLSHFPRSAWAKATAAALRQTPDATLAYPDPMGSPVLRNALADYLRRVRGVVADPRRIVICAGFTQALSLVTRALGRPCVALEVSSMLRNRRSSDRGSRCTPRRSSRTAIPQTVLCARPNCSLRADDDRPAPVAREDRRVARDVVRIYFVYDASHTTYFPGNCGVSALAPRRRARRVRTIVHVSA